jgi:hypothetical protein
MRRRQLDCLLGGFDGGDHRVAARCKCDRRAAAEATAGAGDENGLRHAAPSAVLLK